MMSTLIDMALLSWEKEARRLVEQEDRIETMNAAIEYIAKSLNQFAEDFQQRVEEIRQAVYRG